MAIRLRNVCPICGKGFQFNYLLRRHREGVKSLCAVQEYLKPGETFEPPADLYDDDDKANSDHVVESDDEFKANIKIDKDLSNEVKLKKKIKNRIRTDNKLKCPKCNKEFKHCSSKSRHIKENKCTVNLIIPAIPVNPVNPVNKHELSNDNELLQPNRAIELSNEQVQDISIFQQLVKRIDELTYKNNLLENKNNLLETELKKHNIIVPSINSDNSNPNISISGNIISGNIISNNIHYTDNTKITKITNIIYKCPLGLEDISFLKLKDIIYIFSKGDDISHIITTMTELIYSKGDNINFLKQNLNKTTIQYIDDNHEIKAVHESKFKELFRRVVVETIIKLIHRYKNEVHVNTLDMYINIAERLDNIILSLETEKNKVQFKDELILIQVVNTTIDQVLRSVDKAFIEYLHIIKTNPDVKVNNSSISKKSRREHNTILAEFKLPPKQLAIEDATNLYTAKNRSKAKIEQLLTNGIENVLMKVTTSEDIDRRLAGVSYLPQSSDDEY
jgi:hypothetical protein